MDKKIPLGQEVSYTSAYDPQLLFPVARNLGREKIGIKGQLPFIGVDIWNAYEISWLETGGKPQIGMADIRFSLESLSIIESKSLKLYLNSLNQTHFSSSTEVEQVIRQDLEKFSGGEVTVLLTPPERFHHSKFILPQGRCIDDQELTTDQYNHNSDFLSAGSRQTKECLYSNLLRTNCPVTGQPDWATLVINYTGKEIKQSGLLRYIISFREHTGFHENCAEQIFIDLMKQCAPEKLSVYARFTRRGGIDINPFRATPNHFKVPENIRFARQ